MTIQFYTQRPRENYAILAALRFCKSGWFNRLFKVDSFISLIFYHLCLPDVDVKLISAQCFIMFMAGFKPTSFLMNCLWLEIAKNKVVQQRIQDEIDSTLTKYDNEISCECLHEMTYIDQVISGEMKCGSSLPTSSLESFLHIFNIFFPLQIS